MAVRQRIFGMRTLDRRLNKLAKTLKKGELMHTFMQGGFVFERGMKYRITTMHIIDTGNMRASTKAEPDPSVRHVAVAIGPKGVNYAIYQEFGTRFMAARPFMRQTFDNDQDKALLAMEKSAADKIRRRVIRG